MKNLLLWRLTLTLSAAALFAGCGVLPQAQDDMQLPVGPMAVGAYARNLLYVDLGTVQVFTYPHGRPVGSLGVFASDVCSDKSGNVFFAGGEGISYVWVYAHGGGTPIATLYNPQNAGGCSVDGSSGNLAVADTDASPIVVFPYNKRRGWRLARQYNDENLRASLYCTYDPKGNLFVDGYSTSISFMLVELPKGSSEFTTIALDQQIQSPGSVQWDGKYLAVEDAGASRSSEAVIYRFAISGSYGHEVSATTLTDSAGEGQFLMHGSTVIGPLSSSYAKGIGFWRFPSGGEPVSTISTYGYPTGEALSLK